MKFPSPDHPIAIAPAKGRLTIRAGGEEIVQTRRALILTETTYPPVYYVPPEDTVMRHLERTDHTTYCSYKGTASYFSIATAGHKIENAVWSYQTPYPAMAEIAGHLAFYPSKVDAITFDPE